MREAKKAGREGGLVNFCNGANARSCRTELILANLQRSTHSTRLGGLHGRSKTLFICCDVRKFRDIGSEIPKTIRIIAGNQPAHQPSTLSGALLALLRPHWHGYRCPSIKPPAVRRQGRAAPNNYTNSYCTVRLPPYPIVPTSKELKCKSRAMARTSSSSSGTVMKE